MVIFNASLGLIFMVNRWAPPVNRINGTKFGSLMSVIATRNVAFREFGLFEYKFIWREEDESVTFSSSTYK